jgi:hypothetical protein
VDPQPELLGDQPVRLPRLRETYDVRPSARGRRHRVAWGVTMVLVLVLVVVAAALALVDGSARSRETAAVQACERQLQDASDRADYQMGLTTNYVRSRVVDRSGRTHLADLMAPQARQVLGAVQNAHHACAAVRVQPWHRGLAERQQAASTYAAALVTLLQTVAAQGRGDFGGDETLKQLRAAAGIEGG